MPFLEEELVNFGFKGWLGIFGTGDRYTAPNNAAWYEEPYSLDISVKSNLLWVEDTLIPFASTTADANTAYLANPTLIREYDQTTAVHLTPTLNNRSFFATTTYGDWSTRLKNWIMPQLILDTVTGSASWGYAIRLWNGDPSLGGSEILTSIGQDPGTSRVGWLVQYGAGAIKVSSDFDFAGLSIDPTDLWITGYQYIGKTAENINDGLPSVELVQTTSAVGSPVEIGGLSGSTIVANLTTANTSLPPLGVVSEAGKVVTKGTVSGVTVQNYNASYIGKPCFVNDAGQLDAIRTSTAKNYIKIVGEIVSSTKVYVSPSAAILQLG